MGERSTLGENRSEESDQNLYTRDSHAALHTIAWRPYTEAEGNFKTIVGIFEVSSK